MAAPAPDFRQKVWFYRDPQRTAFLIVLLALLAWSVVGLVRHDPDTYAHEHTKGVILGTGLVASFLAAAYVPRRWGLLANGLALACVLGALAFVLLA